jgi:hypothetical protein
MNRLLMFIRFDVTLQVLCLIVPVVLFFAKMAGANWL